MEDDNGKRIICPHPYEFRTIAEVLRLDEREVSGYPVLSSLREDIAQLIRERTGTLSDCVCGDCLEKFQSDVEKDGRKCPGCKSGNVKTTSELIDQPCPRCHGGIIESIDTGMVC